jgi:hypothetical protein
MAESDVNEVTSVETPAEIKMRLEIRKLKLDVVVASLGIAFAASFSIGAVLLCIYFLRHHFNTGGISGSDTVPIILVGLAFGVTNLICLMYVTLAAFPVSRAGHWLLVRLREQRNAWRLRRRGATPIGEVQLLLGSPIRQGWRDGMTIFWCLGVVCFCEFVYVLIYAGSAMRNFVGSMFPLGIFLSLFVFGTQIPTYSALPRPPPTSSRFDVWMRRQAYPVRRAVAVSAVTFITIMLQIGVTQDASMLGIGYRNHNVSVRLSKEDFQAAVELATRAGYALNACRPLDPATPIIEHMDVLWHKLSTTALIRYPALGLGAEPAAERAAVRLEPLNASLMVMRDVAERDTCSEFLIDTIFRPGRAGFTDRAEPLLDELLNRRGIDPARWNIRIAVIDPGAPELAAAQAAALKAQLIRRYRLGASAIVIDGVRADRKRVCDGTENARSCEIANRRVEIRADAGE